MDANKLINYLRAGFPSFWLKTFEPGRVKTTIYNQVREFVRKDGGQYSLHEWDCNKEADPMKPIATLDSADQDSVMFLYNYHWFIDKPMIIQAIQNRLPIWSNAGKAVVVVSPKNGIPTELEKDFVVLDLPLPKEEEIIETINFIAPDENYIPKGKILERLIKAAKGFTRTELEAVLSLCLIDCGEFDLPTMHEHKAMTIGKSGFLEVLKPTISFKDIIGYDEIKEFVLDTVDKPTAKGIIAIGPPGCGKTSLMQAIVTESQKFGLAVNMGRLQSKWRGETDQNYDLVIKLIEALGDCFVLIDEFEKQFAGAGGSGELDEGTTKRTSGRWLQFLQERPEGIYIAGTANSFQGIPGEYLRPGRWDSSPFFIDLPNKMVRNKILTHYIKKAGMKMPKDRPPMAHYSGAEIEALVHIASMRGISLKDASASIVPQAITMKDNVSALREWAKDACASAEKIPGLKSGGKRRIDT